VSSVDSAVVLAPENVFIPLPGARSHNTFIWAINESNPFTRHASVPPVYNNRGFDADALDNDSEGSKINLIFMENPLISMIGSLIPYNLVYAL